MLWLMELLADEALPEITQPVHEEGVGLQGALHWKVLAPCPVFCVRLSCWGWGWGGREESSLEALSWRQRQVVAPASGGPGMRLRSGTEAGLAEGSAGPAAEVSGSQPHTRDSGAKESLRTPEPNAKEPPHLESQAQRSEILRASPSFQQHSSSQSTFLSFLGLGPLNPLEGGRWWQQEVSSLHGPISTVEETRSDSLFHSQQRME